MKHDPHPKRRAALYGVLALLALPVALHAQLDEDDEEEIIELSPFEVTSEEDLGYYASHTLAGTRLRTPLRDVGSAISVVTEDFMQDTAAVDNESLLQYTVGTEVGGVSGNFANHGNAPVLFENFENASSKTRVRGLARADNTIDYFLTRIPWDNYNVERIDIQRGPNAILFGFGSPAGIINASRIKATDNNEGEVTVRLDDQGSVRFSADVNRVILEDELAVRLAVLNNDHEYRQDPAYEQDRRFYITARYSPEMLQGDSSTTVFTASYERAKIDANRPRAITPIDRVSPWFRPLRLPDGSYNPEQGLSKLIVPVDLAHARDFPMPGLGRPINQRNEGFRTGEDNPDWVPGLHAAPQHFGHSSLYFDGQSGELGPIFQNDPRRNVSFGLGPDGEQDGGISGLVRTQSSAVADYMRFADNMGFPFVELGQYKNIHMTDPSVFDYWNHLIDGPNKWETEDWDHVTLTLAQTFFDNALGYEIAYDRQDYDSTEERFFNGDRVALQVETGETIAEFQIPEGDPNPERYIYTENPNQGRAYMTGTGQFTNSGVVTTRESLRLTAFAEYDFRDRGDSWWRRLLGKHTLTGLLSSEESDDDTRTWQMIGTEDAYGELVGAPDFRHNFRNFNVTAYMGDSLASLNDATEANLRGIKHEIVIPDVVQHRFFDATWNAPGVDPGALYVDMQNGNNLRESTQSENPANYVGWSTQNLRVHNARRGDRDLLTTNLDLARSETESKALILQSYLFHDIVIGMYGYREDQNEVYRVSADREVPTGRILFDSAVLPDEPVNDLTIESESWSLAVDANNLLNLFNVEHWLPLNVRFFYNVSENFRPSAGRIDLYGRPLSPPQGETTDRSLLLSTKDNRFTLRITNYETNLVNDSASVGAAFFIGRLLGIGDNAADRFEFNISGQTLDAPPDEFNTYQPRPGQTEAEAVAEEEAAVSAWRNLQQAFADLSEDLTGDPNQLYRTWGSDRNVTPPEPVQELRPPPGWALTQDVTSEGWEYEFSASPTPNWRLTFNASQNEAVRNNIGGEAFIRHVELMEDLLNNTAAGNLRINDGTIEASTALERFDRRFRGPWELTKLNEGTNAPELREWRFNLVTNYRFTEGSLKGWNVGGGYRWQDDVIIGYPIVVDSNGTPTYDLDNPYRGPTEDDVDLWVGYERELKQGIHWRVQLNVRSVFADKEVIPISTQPDGSVAGVRLGSATSWFLSNTFSF